MRYFFRTIDGQTYPDDEGTELEDLREACIEASRVLGDFLMEMPKEVWTHDCLAVEVSDDSGLSLFTLQLSVRLSPAMAGRHPEV